jgi:hypothetical protein
MAKMNTEVRNMRGEIGADLCQTTTIVRVFLRWGWRFLTEPEAKEDKWERRTWRKKC